MNPIWFFLLITKRGRSVTRGVNNNKKKLRQYFPFNFNKSFILIKIKQKENFFC